MTSICCGAIDSSHESLKFVKERLQKNISVSSQKDGIIERFLSNRCNFSIPDEERDPIFWKLLCYEIMYLWNLLGSCSQQTIQVMIEDCKSAEEKSEPILGISNFLMAACFSLQNDYENAIISYKKCIESYNENPSNLTYVPAYANYELAVILIKHVNDDNKEEIQKLLENAQSWKNFDFEHRLRLKVHNVKIN